MGDHVTRIAGGIAGWLAGLFPLIVVNLLGGLNILNSEEAAALAAAALLLGPTFGGLAAGALGVRSGRPGAASRTGAIAAILYLVSLVALVVIALRPDAIPVLMAEHPIRTVLVVVCMISLAGLLLAVAFATGAWAGRRRRASHPQFQATAQARPGGRDAGARVGYGGPPSGVRYPASRISARRPAGAPPTRPDARR